MTRIFTKISTLTLTAMGLALTLAPSALAGEVATPRLKPMAGSLTTYIGIARIDEGRLTIAPENERNAWSSLAKQVHGIATLAPVTPHSLREVSAPYPEGTWLNDNSFDEIRMAATEQGQRYVLIYGQGLDAARDSFGGKAITDTGFAVSDQNNSSPKGELKGYLVGSYSGTIYAIVTSNAKENAIEDFTTHVGQMLEKSDASEEPVTAS
ncbi:MAG: hypothetical protein V3U82_09000 [Robiginitomaculum sp.]